MSIQKRKPIEPIIVLLGAATAFIIGLNLNFVSLRYLGFTVLGITGLEIIESLVLFGISFLVSILAIVIYYFGNSQKMVILSRNVAITGIIPGLLCTFLFVIGQHQGREIFIKQIIELSPQTTEEAASQFVDLLSVDFGLGISFAGLLAMGLGAYMLNNSKHMYLGESKGSLLFHDLSNLESDKETVESLKALWFCPNENNKLTSNVSRAVPNPEFRVSRERLDENLNNAVAMRKISNDVLPHAKALAELLLRKTDDPEVELVGTICSVCRNRYVSPKLSHWLNK